MDAYIFQYWLIPVDRIFAKIIKNI